MLDNCGREIDYMRISITDRCNLRCRYCMPHGIQTVPSKEILTYEEILQVCEQAAAVGIRKIRITGGEPLVRLGAPELIGRIKRLPGIEAVTMTTNGVLLPKYLKELTAQGLDAVNISLDTMDAELYRKITGYDSFDRVLEGIDEAVYAGLKVKVNAVLQKDMAAEWKPLIELARERPVDVRFIELMPIGTGKNMEGVSGAELLKQMEEAHPNIEEDHTVHGNGPAVYYRIPGYMGGIGFISAIHGKFCESCNRIRMSAAGMLKPCLCYADALDIKGPLRRHDPEEVRAVLMEAIRRKPKAHCFEHPEDITEEKRMVSIGG